MAQELLFRGNYIRGQFVKVTDPNGELLVRDPGDLATIYSSIPYSFEHVHQAVDAAKRSFLGWRQLKSEQRITAIDNYRKFLRQHSKQIAECISLQIGKPLWESQMEVDECLRMIDYFIKQGSQTSIEIKVAEPDSNCVGTIRYFSLGVMAVVCPSATPLLTPHSQFIPALIHGDTVVLKSSRYAPYVGQWCAELWHDAALPAGVLNVVHGETETGRRLCSHGDVDGVFFSGCYETGAKVQKQLLSDYWKLLVADMGGKNALVVWEDANYAMALQGAMIGTYLTTGQRGTSTSRILVHEKIFDRFVTDFHALSKKCHVGYSMDTAGETPLMGPLVSESTLEIYLRYQGIAVREGAEEIMRGKTLERHKKGYYVSPSIHVVAKPDAKSIYQASEVFGPNVAFFRIGDLEEAAEIINMPRFGLVASVYCSSREIFVKLLEHTRVGLLHWNRPTTDSAYPLAYGGFYKSGNFRPMGRFSGNQCTYAVSSLEQAAFCDPEPLSMPLPKV